MDRSTIKFSDFTIKTTAKVSEELNKSNDNGDTKRVGNSTQQQAQIGSLLSKKILSFACRGMI